MIQQDPSEDMDILIEFAEDSQLVLEEIRQALTLSAETDQLTPETLNTIHRDLISIMGSAEFLDIGPVFEIASTMAGFFDNISNRDGSPHDAIELGMQGVHLLQNLLEQLVQGKRVTNLNSAISELRSAFKSLEVPGEATPQPAEPEPLPPQPVAPQPPTPISEPEVHEIGQDDLPDEFRITITAEMLKTFLSEAEEHLEAAESELLALERDFKDTEAIGAAFRAMHTFKGNCGLFAYADLEAIGHCFESVLEDYKSGGLKPDKKGISLMLKTLDVLKLALGELPDGSGKVPDRDQWVTQLNEYQTKGHVSAIIHKSDSALLGEILVELGYLERTTLESALRRQALPLGEILQDQGAIEERQLDLALQVQQERRRLQSADSARKVTSNQNIRVDLHKLDALINLVGELIIAENMVTHNPDLEGHVFENFKKASLHLNRISRELQDNAMSLRMVPIEATFRKMIRVVRDVSQRQGKQVTLHMAGEDTEVDKSVVENIANPLLHIIRNAIDHGIELPDDREKLGKPRTGSVWLSAMHQGGEILIEIRDDGRGIDPDRILAKARQKGLVPPHFEPTHQDDIYDLIFEPGFSTADQLTDISGRGVGMDVVKKNVEAIKGRIHISSSVGKGTLISIRIPLTLAIIDGMLVRVGTQLLTLPLLSIRESIRCQPKHIHRTIDRGEMLRIRERLLPVIRLHETLDISSDNQRLEDGILVVVESGNRQVALFVDEICGQYQTVIKGLSSYLGAVRAISGTAILSNGDISLILDIQDLVADATQSGWDAHDFANHPS
ncbi:Histidine kinase [Sulfidibacter corallicola]|uniref:Chemotaxis protein CheA n=1 Tax=Sulfidibacter corallicola TaxID=2818388 RepID=A0A8A4TFZ1_SULCO|nr:chemotaxis protein CheA [Sulfidibacter corallicola]QTD47628.1 chemotaxis protein CheA [Sulfidibacter corallicola]